jgi:hypothetical protein
MLLGAVRFISSDIPYQYGLRQMLGGIILIEIAIGIEIEGNTKADTDTDFDSDDKVVVLIPA